MDYTSYKKDFDRLKNARSNWDRMYQALGEYVSMVKQNFEGQPADGEFLMDEIFDSTGAYAAINAASAMSGMLWAGSAKQSVFLDAPDDMEMTTEAAEFYEYITNKLTSAFDDPKANFSLAFDEHLLDQRIFGTSGVGVERGEDSILKFKPYGVKELYIDEGRDGRVNKIFLFYEWDAKRVVAEYGAENVSEKTRKSAEAKNGNVKVLVCIVPRTEFKAKRGALAMPYMSLHMEYDTCHPLKESGYSDLPIKVCRARKLSYEKYGRSEAMFALPDIKEANILREAVIVATEKNLDPPLGVLDDGVLGGGVIDTSAGAISVFNASEKSGNSNPVFPLVTVGSIGDALVRLEKLEQTIAQHFYIDRLLDFNNETQMTFGEAQIRAGIRSASLSSLFAREIAEVLTPLVDRAASIMFQLGELGVVEGSDIHRERVAESKEFFVIPDEIVKRIESGQDIYRVGYRTQASKAARSEEYLSIIDIVGFNIQAMQVDPSTSMRVNLHEAIKQLSDIRGVPVGIIREDDEVEAMMAEQAQQQQAQATLEQAGQAAGIVEQLASANKAARE